MVAFTSFVFFLAAAQSLLAAPLGHPSHGSHPSHMQRRRACAAENVVSTKSVVVEASTTTIVPESTSTTAKTSAKATPTAKLETNALASIWPLSISKAKATWTTSSLVDGHAALNDKSLNIFSGASTPHAYDTAPDGSAALRALYKKGSTSPGHTDLVGGFSMYALTGVDLTKGKEILFSYKAYFPKGFDFKKGGKMPGLFMGTSNEVARKCSGGQHQSGNCASSRMMFRTGGAGELYAYFPQTAANTKALKTVKPTTVDNDTYGTSVGRGSFKWATGDWTAISQRVKLNDVGSKNGEFQVWVNGESIMNISGLEFRTSNDFLVRGAQLQTFFGGHDSSWASPKDQYSWFKDIAAAILS